MYASLWTLLLKKRKLNDLPCYYRIWYRRPEENIMHDIRLSELDDVIRWIIKKSDGCIWVVEESRMLLTDEEI